MFIREFNDIQDEITNEIIRFKEIMKIKVQTKFGGLRRTKQNI
jgi:hypothetical protein